MLVQEAFNELLMTMNSASLVGHVFSTQLSPIAEHVASQVSPAFPSTQRDVSAW
jgi:hypothetical protein